MLVGERVYPVEEADRPAAYLPQHYAALQEKAIYLEVGHYCTGECSISYLEQIIYRSSIPT